MCAYESKLIVAKHALIYFAAIHGIIRSLKHSLSLVVCGCFVGERGGKGEVGKGSMCM